MSKTNTHLYDEKSEFYKNSTSSMKTTSKFHVDNNSLCMPTITICESLVPHTKEIPISNSGYPQFSTIYQSPFTVQTTDAANDSFNCWNNIASSQIHTKLPCDSNSAGSIVTWGQMIPQNPYVNQRNRLSEDKTQQRAGLGDNSMNNGLTLSNYSLLNDPINYSKYQNILNNTDNYDFMSTIEDSNCHFPYSDKQQNTSLNNEMFQPIPNIPMPLQNTIYNQTNCYAEAAQQEHDIHTFPKSWLISNFIRVNDECTIARSLIYSYYVFTCHVRGRSPMNSAGLGKVLRGIFGPIKNRRLGARGDSRYHYLELRINPRSYLIDLPIEEVNKIVALYEVKKINEKRNKVAEYRSDSSVESQEMIGEECFNIRQECKKIVELQNKPMSYFLHDFLKLTKFNIQVSSIETILKNNEKSQNYAMIFDQIDKCFLEMESHAIECFRKLDSQSIYQYIYRFWNYGGKICINQNTNKEPQYTQLRSCTCDVQVRKYIEQYDIVFYNNLIDLLLGDITKCSCTMFIYQLINMMKSIEQAIVDSFNSSQYHEILRQKIKINTDMIKILEDYKKLQEVRLETFEKISTAEPLIIQFCKIVSNNSDQVYTPYFRETFTNLSMNIRNVDEMIQLYSPILTAPLIADSSEWLRIIYNQMHTIYNNSGNIISCCTFIANWLSFSNILVGSYKTTQKHNSELIILNNFYFSFMQILCENANQKNIIRIYLQQQNVSNYNNIIND